MKTSSQIRIQPRNGIPFITSNSLKMVDKSIKSENKIKNENFDTAQL